MQPKSESRQLNLEQVENVLLGSWHQFFSHLLDGRSTVRVLAALVVVSVAKLVTTPQILGIDQSDVKRSVACVCS